TVPTAESSSPQPLALLKCAWPGAKRAPTARAIHVVATERVFPVDRIHIGISRPSPQSIVSRPQHRLSRAQVDRPGSANSLPKVRTSALARLAPPLTRRVWVAPAKPLCSSGPHRAVGERPERSRNRLRARRPPPGWALS